MLILLGITAALTWYSRQSRNNPFAAEPHVTIAGDSTCSCIRFSTRNAPEQDIAVILLDLRSARTCKHRTPQQENWYLLTAGFVDTIDRIFPVPPHQWFVAGYFRDSLTAPDEWPVPLVLSAPTVIGGVDVVPMPEPDGAAGWFSMKYGTLTVGLLPAACVHKRSWAGFVQKEYFDVVVAAGADDTEAEAIREDFRPAYIVALPDEPDGGSSGRVQNILRPRNREFRYDFSKGSRGRLRLE